MSFHPPPGAVALPGLTKLDCDSIVKSEDTKTCFAEKVARCFFPVINPSLPCHTSIPMLTDGLLVIIQGHVTPDAKGFHINFTCSNVNGSPDDIAFHFNPRFTAAGAEVVVCNSLLNSQWGTEERTKLSGQLQKGEEFECLVLVTDDSYKVALCGIHFCEYVHRVRKELVTGLSVGGDVEIQAIFYPNAEQDSLSQSDKNQRNAEDESETKSPLDVSSTSPPDVPAIANLNISWEVIDTSSNPQLQPQNDFSTVALDSQLSQELQQYDPYPLDTIPSNYSPVPLVTPEPSAPEADANLPADISTFDPVHISGDLQPRGYTAPMAPDPQYSPNGYYTTPVAVDPQYSPHVTPYDHRSPDIRGSNVNPLPLPAQQCYADGGVAFPVLNRPSSKESFPPYPSCGISPETFPMPSVEVSTWPVVGQSPISGFMMAMAPGYGAGPGIYPSPCPLMQPRNVMHFYGGMRIGQMLTVNAIPDQAADWFRLHFKPSESVEDVLFLFYVNFNEGTLIRNSILDNGQRGKEERDVNFFPFHRGKLFQMKILCEIEMFKVAVDDIHILEFRHRVDPRCITFLYIDGAVNVDGIFST